MVSLTANIKRFAKKTGLRLDTVVRKLTLDAYTGLLFRSPVDTGRFRNSWRIGIGQPNTSVEIAQASNAATKKAAGTTAKYGNPASGAELSKAVAASRAMKAGMVIYITNNLPYAKVLEDGSSGQNSNKPDGILGDTFKELAAKFDETVRTAEVES